MMVTIRRTGNHSGSTDLLFSYQPASDKLTAGRGGLLQWVSFPTIVRSRGTCADEHVPEEPVHRRHYDPAYRQMRRAEEGSSSARKMPKGSDNMCRAPAIKRVFA